MDTCQTRQTVRTFRPTAIQTSHAEVKSEEKKNKIAVINAKKKEIEIL